ncbi:MAG: zinc ribbon domain-containing protein [Lachnospiraceae bacterium]|nr:zinc ribbon domain-containing protein [Lachnospiraceae bacterium]
MDFLQFLPLIIVLVLILAIIIAIFCAVRAVQRKIRRIKSDIRHFSQAAFGTTDITKGAEKMREEMASTPKSVSGMTSLLLPKINSDFPDFNYNEMKERANNVLTSYLRAVNDNNTGLLTDGSEELQQQLENQIQMNSSRRVREHYEQIRIHKTEINQYRKTEGRCIITFQSAVECYHYTTDESNAVKAGSRDYKLQTKFNTDLIYVQDRNLIENELDNALGVNCPNCGAPISALGAKFCEYCGSGIVELNIKAWTFNNIEEKN